MRSDEFLNLPQKSITLIGMSGAGKTHISCLLSDWGWHNYSCDYEIGQKFLKDELASFGDGRVCIKDIGALSSFLGKLGRIELGGYPFELFQERQKAYYNAECKALKAMRSVHEKTQKHFVHDSTGSLCEIEDGGLLQDIGKQTLFVYLETDGQTDKDVLRRAYDYPKPLFFPSEFLESAIEQFLTEHNISQIDDIVPDDFARWVFPMLFAARKPKYKRLADLYGVSIPASSFKNLTSEKQFIDIIAQHLEN